jgi:hypothetical protein
MRNVFGKASGILALLSICSVTAPDRTCADWRRTEWQD